MAERTIIIKKGSAGSMLTGMLIGAGLALLFAPRTGSETRSMLDEKGLEIRDKATDLARDTSDRVQQSLLDARNKMQEKMRSMKEGAFITAETRQMKEEMEYMEEISNRDFPL